MHRDIANIPRCRREQRSQRWREPPEHSPKIKLTLMCVCVKNGYSTEYINGIANCRFRNLSLDVVAATIFSQVTYNNDDDEVRQ